MPHAATSQFFDGLRASRVLDDVHVGELESRPEAEWGDVVSLTKYAQERGWLTAYQAQELREGRGHRLAVAGYRIFDKLDDGPAGVTFKAVHPAIVQPVSLRIVRPDWLAPADTAADYLARVQKSFVAQSPHLAGVLDAGTHEDAPFVVQEYVDGCHLFRLVNELGALPVGLACEYARQAAVALQAAHEKGIPHGDVSPYALVLSPVKRAAAANGEESVRPRPGATVKLADLGLAPRRPPIGQFTYGESDRLGAVAFLPPERLTSGERTAAADLYGLGATLYYLLTSRTPHAGDTPLAVLLDLQQSQPRPLESLRSAVPIPVSELVERLMNRDPANRPSAAEAAATLAPYCEASAVPDDPVPLASETSTFPSVPTAIPIPPGSVEAHANGSAVPLVEVPIVEPLPEAPPADEHGYTDVGQHDRNPFGSSTVGRGSRRIVRNRTQPTRKNLVWIIAGLVLHLVAVALLIGYLTNWFGFSR